MALKAEIEMNETSCEKEFNDFIKRISGAEIISDLHAEIPKEFKIADYFFENRRVIGELKCLEIDTGKNIQVGGRGRFPRCQFSK